MFKLYYMKLKTIAEKSTRPVRDSAKSFGSLIQYINNNFDKRSNEYTSLYNFLSNPTITNWQKSKWVIDSAIKQALTDPKTAQDAKEWAFLKSVTSPTVVASIYDIDQKKTKGTPLQSISLSEPQRNKLKSSLGPEGYISTLSNIGGEIANGNKLKRILKGTAKNSTNTIKSIKKDIPSVKTTNKF